ncbi:hypothetical protein PAHAL_6G064900 [Panicum hallii]|uniref:Uncharacterized protein n=1 Tax=Panicum hallii TaxID=206008 RepID=A0A2T8IFD9_9POAL|nr:uncharacterized protein LOC112897673 isoform X2 [Panicum hallii]PVH36390.1 hypothetical protein PAHAL_6G064900 [Panicum hallii]
METDQQRSTQRWERLRRAAESNEFLIERTDTWDDRVEHDAGDDLLMERRESLVKRWRWLKAVSMVVFSGRPAYKMQIEPSHQPTESQTDHLLAAAKTDLGVNRPQPTTTAQVQDLQSPRHTTKLRSNNPVPEVVIMDVEPNLPRSTETAQVQSWLSPRHAAKSPNNSVPEVVVDVTSNLPRPTETSQVVDKMKKEQQGRCLKYSQKALGFAICTLIGYASAVSLSPSSNGGNDGKKDNATFKLAIAPFFVAICTDLFSLKTKAKQGNVLVYLSSFHLMLMIYLIFISFNMDYAYAIIFLPLVAGASLLQQKIWPEGHRQSTDEKVSKDLDSMFDLSALILNWSTFISAIMAIFRDLIPSGQNQYISFSAVGLLFFLTIILGLYLMLITTVRTAALNLRAKYLDVLLICLLVSTLITALITFIKKK